MLRHLIRDFRKTRREISHPASAGFDMTDGGVKPSLHQKEPKPTVRENRKERRRIHRVRSARWRARHIRGAEADPSPPFPHKPRDWVRDDTAGEFLASLEMTGSRYAVGRRAMIFLATVGGRRVAILRIMARTRRLSPSESVLLYFLISARKRISS